METTVKKIHREFREAIQSSSIMEQINKVSSNDEATENASKYKDLLHRSGLSNSKPYLEAQQILDKQEALKNNQHAFREILENQATYPKRRLIGLKQLVNICRKYNLHLANIWQYKGDIPEKNLMEIIDFYSETPPEGKFKSFKFRFENGQVHIDTVNHGNVKDMLLVVAPINLLNVDNTYVFDRFALSNDVKYGDPGKFKFEFKVPEFKIPTFQMDPIILFPSISNQLGQFFNIVTAWGDESEDEYVTNKIKIEHSDN